MVDRISQLPDETLSNILRFVPSIVCVSTSTLSKRWKHLYRSVPVIDVVWEDSKLPKLERKDLMDHWSHFDRCHEHVKKFEGFVENMVDLPRTINKFWFRSDARANKDRLNQWMFWASQPGRVRDLCLSIPGEGQRHTLVLPLGLHSLLKLELGRNFILKLSSDDSFPVFESLKLDILELVGNEIQMIRLLLISPKLTEIILHNLIWDVWQSSTLSSQSLKKMTVHCLRSCSRPKIVSFYTPAVDFFDYEDHIARKYGKLNFRSLVQARINLLLNDETDGLDASALFKAISNVKRLFLSSTSLRVLSLYCVVVLRFNNLLHLTVGIDMDAYWPPSLPLLVEGSPNLETLVLKGDVHRCHLEGEATSHPIEQCLKSCKIKVVELYPETTFNIVVGMVELFLGRLRWLEQFKVYCHVIDAGSEELVKRIMAQPKASPNCKFQMLPIII